MDMRDELLRALQSIASYNDIPLEGAIPPHANNADYVPPNNGKLLFTANLALAITATVVVLTRFWTRAYVAGGVGGDDYTISAAMVVILGGAALNCYGVERAGVGKHFYDLSLEQVRELLKFTYALPMVYSLSVVIIKVSILLFYRRLFGMRKTLQKMVLIFLVFQLVFALGSIPAFAFICLPVGAWWDLELRASSCPTFRQTMILYVSLRVVTVACDIGVLLLPLPLVWRLKIPTHQRVGLACLFSLGLLACAVAVIRLVMLPRLMMSMDVPWNILPIALLDQVEQCLGVITASIPALTALITRARLVDRTSYSPKASESQPRSRSDYDFLKFAYDPDGQNLGFYATAYSGHVYMSDEQLVGGQEISAGVIQTTTTVTVNISAGYKAECN